MALLGDGTSGRQVDAFDGVHRDLGQPVGLGGGHFFDLHAALHRAHREVGAVRAVEQEGDVVLLGDVAGLGDQQFLDDVTLDVQAEDVLGVFVRVFGSRGVLDTAGLAAAAGLDLRLDHHRATDLGGDRLSAVGGIGHPTGSAGDVVLVEQFFRLILEKVHGLTVFVSAYR